MNPAPISQPRDRKSRSAFWTYSGAFLFAVILIVLVHETGHYLAFRWHGYAASMRINPFMGVTSSQQAVQPEDYLYIILAGSVFNLTLAGVTAILLRFAKHRSWILLRMYACMAFLIEGMVLIAGLFFTETVTDFSWLISLGLSPVWVGMLGIALVVIGGLLNYEIWGLVGITPRSSFLQILLLNSFFLVYGLLGAVIGLVILPIETQFVRNFLIVATLLHWLFFGIRAALNPWLMPRIQPRWQMGAGQVPANSGWLSMVVGSAAWVASLLVLN